MTISQISCLTPIRFNGDGCHTFRNIPIGTLVEHTTTDAIQILISAVTVGEVVGRCIFTSSKTACRTARYRYDLPPRYYTVFGIVLCSHIIIIWQLYLAVVEVEALKVLVSDWQGEIIVGNACTIWRRIRAISSHLNRDRKIAQFFSYVAFTTSRSVFCINVNNGWIFSMSLQYWIRFRIGVGSVCRLQYPFHHLVLIVVTRGIPCRQFKVAVQKQAVELEAL